MGITATDILVKSMMEAALTDLRANHWILEDIFSCLADDPLAAPEAGWKEVKAAVDWFLRTDIPVLLQHRIADAPKVPCISIAYQPSREMDERASLGDEGHVGDYLVGNGRGPVAINRITSPFTPDAYDTDTGIVRMPEDFNTDLLSIGNFYVSPKSGNAYAIRSIVDNRSFSIDPNVSDDFLDSYVIPKNNVWNVHRELTYILESYSIGCHTQNDSSSTYWLWQIVLYSFFRYKEAFLEGRGFTLSTVTSSALERNPEFPGENVFSRYLTLTGQVEANWIKFIAPKSESVRVSFGLCETEDAPDLKVYGDNPEDCPPSWYTGDDFDPNNTTPAAPTLEELAGCEDDE